MRAALAHLAWIILVGTSLYPATRAQDTAVGPADTEIPAAFMPFEHVIGAWKGVGIPTANKLKGWNERHIWSWSFEGGKPVALSLELEGNKTLSKGRLTFEPATGLYTLTASDPEGNPVVFAGKIDEKRQNLTLDRSTPLEKNISQRLVFRLNSNLIRYLIWDERKAPGAPRFTRTHEMQMGKEGEAFAAGATATNLPRCILTGGAATLTVTYNGKSYPVCCTGCRDEFEADPERWLRKLAQKGASDGSVQTPEREPRAEPAGDTPPRSDTRPAASNDKAAGLWKRADELERAGKNQAALSYYRILVKDHAGTQQANQAAQRIEALTGKN